MKSLRIVSLVLLVALLGAMLTGLTLARRRR